MQQHQLAPSKAKENQHAPGEQPTSQRQSSRMKKQMSAAHYRAQGSQQQVGGQHGPPISLPLLQQPKQSRNSELGEAKTQKTPQYRSKDKGKLASSPLSGGKEAKNGLFDSIPEVISKSKLAAGQQQPKTPQKTRRNAAITDTAHKDEQPPGGHQQNNGSQNSAGKGNTKSSQRKVKRSKSRIAQAGVNGEPGEVFFNTFNQHEAVGQAEQLPNDDEAAMDDKEMINNDLQGSESKLSKYDRMIQSLEEVATKQRRITTNLGSAKKKMGNSTEATDQHEPRFGALSISSGISKNTGSNTIVNRERLAQLQLYQQQQQMLITKQQIFDRNRPWNCDYCQPKQSKFRFVDKKLDNFSRKCLALIVSRFMIKEEFYESRKVVELLNTNSRSVLVAQFKDYLIYDDIYEFLTSLYDIDASLDILTRHAVFYDSLSSLEVLCQYREDQIRDRHLVLHGLKPCYVGLEKQIQEILCSNLRNKLRLILNQVRKVQLARGIATDSSQEDSGCEGSSQQSSPAKTPRSGLTALQRAAASNAKKKTDFKKLIQSSMVKDYNFSRSQSGLLVARDITGDAPMITTRQQFGTNSSINFTNISYEGEVEMLKGSVFEEESFDREVLFESTQKHVNNENIESQYMNAQMILDDLSSRPLTRQSIAVDNTATPASRINMYELHKQEDHKIRLPFCLAPEKPLDQNSSSASMASLHISKDVMKTINRKMSNDTGSEELVNYGLASAVANKEPDCSKEQDNNHPVPLSHPSEAQDNLTESGDKQTALNFSHPFKLPAPHHETDEGSIRLPEKSGASKDTVPFDSQRNKQVTQRLPAGLLQASTQQVINFDPQFRCAITETTPTSPAKHYEFKLLHPSNDSNNSQNLIPVRLETQQNEDDSSQDLNFKQALKYQHPKAVSKVTGNGKATTPSQPISLKTTVLRKQQKKQKKNQGLQQQIKEDDGGIFIAQVVTPLNKRSFNCPNGHQNQQQYQQQYHTANSKALSGHPSQQIKMRGGSPPVLKDGVKAASPAIKNFNMHQFKLMSSSTRTLPTAQLQSRQIAAKKLNLMKSSKQQLASVAADGSQREIFQSLPRMTETTEKEKIKMSRKLMAQLKKDIQLSPSQYKSQQQLITDKDDTKKDKRGGGVASAKHLHSQAESPVIHAISRQATGKNLQAAKTAYEMTFKTCATTIQNSAGKQNKQSSASKRNDTRGKSSVQRMSNAVAGSTQIVLSSGENAFEENAKNGLQQNQLCLSQDNKLNPQSKNQQRSLKEQVILEALRKQQQCSSNDQLVQSGKAHGHQLMNQYSQSQVAGVTLYDTPQQNDSKVNKLVRTQTSDASGGAFLPQSKSTVVANKVDLLSIAGKLKILGQEPTKNKNGTVISSSIKRQHADSQCRKTLKLNSRKISLEQRDDVQFSRNKAANVSQKRQNSLRYLSADFNLNHLSGSAESSQQLVSQQQNNQLIIDSKLKMSQAAAQQQMMKKIAVPGSSNRKLIIPQKSGISQQPEAFASARNRPNVMISPCVSQPNFHHAQQQTAGQYSQNQFQSPHQQLQVQSRNNGQCLASENGSLDQRQMNQLKMVTKTLNELQKQNNGVGTKRGNSNHNVASPQTIAQKSHTTTGATTGVHNSTKKGKIQKLNRACTGSIVSPQVVIESLESIKASGTSTHKQSIVSPRPKNVKDGGGPAGESKSRNMPLGGSNAKGNAMTQGQPQRMVTFQNGGGGHSAGGSFLQQQQTQYHSLKQNLTTTKSGQQLYHHGATTLSPSLSTHQHHQNSRNAGLGMVNHHTTTVKQTTSLALTSELQEKIGGQGVGAHLPFSMGKTLQPQTGLDSTPSVQASQAALTVGSSTPAAQVGSLMPPNSLTPLTAAIMKQDAKIHQRKNSATYTRAQGGQKLHTLSHNQLGQVPIGAISMGSGVSKPFVGGPITNTLSPGMAAGGPAGPMKKTKKKQQ